MLKQIINNFFKFIKYLTTVFIKETLNFLKFINLILDKTGHKMKILFTLFTIIILFVSINKYRNEINLLIFDNKIRIERGELEKISERKNEMKEEYDDFLKKEIFNKIEDFAKIKREQCVKQIVLNFKLENRKINNIPEEDIINLVKLNAYNNECLIEKINEEVYSDFIEIPFKELLLSHLKDFEEKNKKIEEERKKEEVLLIEKINKSDVLNIPVIHFNEKEASKKKFFNKSGVKAIFCSYGHGLKSNGIGFDNGAISHFKNKKIDGVTERQLIELHMGVACKKIKKYADSKGIAFYEIGKKRNSLVGKINQINEISLKNGYDEGNSLLIELHWNKHKDVTKNGTEIFFSQLEGNNGIDFAKRMLYEIKKIRGGGNYFAVKSDRQTKFKQLGILSNTKPLSVLIEYGFLSNEKDTIEAVKGNKNIADGIANGVINFIN